MIYLSEGSLPHRSIAQRRVLFRPSQIGGWNFLKQIEIASISIIASHTKFWIEIYLVDYWTDLFPFGMHLNDIGLIFSAAQLDERWKPRPRVHNKSRSAIHYKDDRRTRAHTSTSYYICLNGLWSCHAIASLILPGSRMKSRWKITKPNAFILSNEQRLTEQKKVTWEYHLLEDNNETCVCVWHCSRLVFAQQGNHTRG